MNGLPAYYPRGSGSMPSLPHPDRRDRAPLVKEMPPRIQEPLGGYIFVCNDETMVEDFERRLFGLPRNHFESVKGIRKGLPLFLYNYSTRCLHGVFEASSDGGLNLEPDAWEAKDPKLAGEKTSRFPAQVRVRVREIKSPLEEDVFRPVLFHYEQKKFRLELTHTEAEKLLKLFGASTQKVESSADCSSDNEWEKVRGKNKINKAPPILKGPILNSPRKRNVAPNGFTGAEYGTAFEGRADLAHQWRSNGESLVRAPDSSTVQGEQLKEDANAYANKPSGLQAGTSDRNTVDSVECSSSSRGSYVAALKTGIQPDSTEGDKQAVENRAPASSKTVALENGNHDARKQAGDTAIFGRLHDPDPAVNSAPVASGPRHHSSVDSTRRNNYRPKSSYEFRKQKEENHRKQGPLIQLHPSVPFTSLPHVPILRFPVYPTQVGGDLDGFGYRPVQRNALDADLGVYNPVQHGSWTPQQPVMLVGPPPFSLPPPAIAANVESNFEVLHAEILEFARTARPSPAARARAEAAVECVRRGVKQLWPGADVEVFGSFATGLCLPHSDVDVVVLDAPSSDEVSGASGFIPLIRNLASELKGYKWCEDIRTIETASMPVIKLRCNPSLEATSEAACVAIDVTMGGRSSSFRARGDARAKKRRSGKFMHNGAAAREYVIEKLRQLPALAPLVLLMKSYLHHKRLNDVYTGGLGSFSLTLMLVFYLEQVPVSWSSLPGNAPVAPVVSSSEASVASSLSELSDSDDDVTDSTSTTASEDGSSRPASTSPVSAPLLRQQEALITRAWRIVDDLLASLQVPGAPNLGSLLIGFLHIFGQEFDFSRTRIVLKGANGGSGGMFVLEPSSQPTCLWIDDPLRPGMNVGAGSFAMWNVQIAMREMLFVLAKPQPPSTPAQQQQSQQQQQKRSLPHLDQLFPVAS